MIKSRLTKLEAVKRIEYDILTSSNKTIQRIIKKLKDKPVLTKPFSLEDIYRQIREGRDGFT